MQIYYAKTLYELLKQNISSSEETITESESTMKTMLKATINQAFEDNNLI